MTRELRDLFGNELGTILLATKVLKDGHKCRLSPRLRQCGIQIILDRIDRAAKRMAAGIIYEDETCIGANEHDPCDFGVLYGRR